MPDARGPSTIRTLLTLLPTLGAVAASSLDAPGVAGGSGAWHGKDRRIRRMYIE